MTAADNDHVRSVPNFPHLGRVMASRLKIERQTWKNRAIYDLNGKETKFQDCDFSYSEIDLGYFHMAEFRNCKFVGVRFTNCNFKSARFYGCDFSWAHFSRCQIDVKEILSALPSSPNIRQEALKSLKANAIEVGDIDSLSLLTLQEIEATKRHYSYALRGTETYYKEKYSTFFSKIFAGYRLISMVIAGIVWGHGEKPWQLLASCICMLMLLSLINLWGVLPTVSWAETNEAIRIVEYVFRLFLDMNTDARFGGFPAVDYMVVILRYVYIGLFISILYKSISRR